MKGKIYHTYYPSPIGILNISFKAQGLLRINFAQQVNIIDKNNHCLDFDDIAVRKTYNHIFDQLNEYFTGKRKNFDLPVLLEGTDFEKKVWNALFEIPYGCTTSYQEISKMIGYSSAARAVGNANRKNPIAIIVPCHRVIGADGKLRGYASGVWRKEWLLKHELKNSHDRERKSCFV